jgi:hypothetical protein
MEDRSIPNSGQLVGYRPPTMPTQIGTDGPFIQGTAGTAPFQQNRAASLAVTLRDNTSEYGPPQMPTQTSPGTAGTFQHMRAASLGSTMLGLKGKPPISMPTTKLSVLGNVDTGKIRGGAATAKEQSKFEPGTGAETLLPKMP